MPRDRVLALILAGGKGSRLEPLTRERSKPAVTKLSRRGYVTGKVAPGTKTPKAAPEAPPATEAAAPAAPAAEADASAADASAADVPAADEAPAEEASE